MEPLLDSAAAAEALADLGSSVRSEKTLRKLRCTGGGPRFRRLGHKPVYRLSDLESWIEERLSEPSASNAEIEVQS